MPGIASISRLCSEVQLLDGLVGCTDSCSLQGRVAELAAVSMREAALVPSTGDILAMGLTLTACFEYLKGSSPTSLQIPIFEENNMAFTARQSRERSHGQQRQLQVGLI